MDGHFSPMGKTQLSPPLTREETPLAGRLTGRMPTLHHKQHHRRVHSIQSPGIGTVHKPIDKLDNVFTVRVVDPETPAAEDEDVEFFKGCSKRSVGCLGKPQKTRVANKMDFPKPVLFDQWR